MRIFKSLCIMVLMCAALPLASGAQKKPSAQEQTPAQEPQVRPRPGQIAPQQNKIVARRVFEEIINRGHYEAVDQVFDPHCKVHFGPRTLGLSQAMVESKGWRAAAPDMFMNAEEVSENGDKVTVVWSARGTHTGEGLGVKPTRRQVSMRDKTVFLIKNGKIVEVWNSEYRQELFRRLGVSKTAASMFDTTERLWAAISQMLPDPLYAALQ